MTNRLVRLSSNDPTLTTLYILSKPSQRELIDRFTTFRSNTRLQEFYSSGHELERDTLNILAEALGDHNRSIRSLCVGDSSFGNDGVSVLLPALQRGGTVVKLDLENKNIGKAGARIIGSCGYAALRHVNLARNDICDEGFIDMVSSPSLILEVLDVSDCNLTSLSFSSLTPSSFPSLSSLRHLNIDGNNIGGDIYVCMYFPSVLFI